MPKGHCHREFILLVTGLQRECETARGRVPTVARMPHAQKQIKQAACVCMGCAEGRSMAF